MGLRDRGVKTANFYMLRESRMPAILTEGGFMDSTVDIHSLRSDTSLRNQGEAIAEALAVCFKLEKKPVAKEEPTMTEPNPSIVSPSHKPAWEWAKSKGFLTEGEHPGMRPKDNLTREQFATVLKRVFDELNK